ncbi:MAG: anhydro-N-acetylmuramic acid kinase [Parvibaculaceae bacterium]
MLLARVSVRGASITGESLGELLTAIGLMSGTSMDGIDVALIRTDGEARLERGPSRSYPYDADFRRRLVEAHAAAQEIRVRTERPGPLIDTEQDITDRHAAAVGAFLEEFGLPREEIGIIGFHGQTVLHRPQAHLTVQLGDGARLAKLCGRPVVNDLRVADVESGGQGAPLVPVYHRALAAGLPHRPVAFVNIGGVSNITWIGGEDILAFDTGPGNALMDDWALRHTGKACDMDGALARSGTADRKALHTYLSEPFFDEPVPKSLDRGSFRLAPVERLEPADGAATLAQVTAMSVARARDWFREAPALWVICGGGRRNRYLMELLAWHIEAPVVPAEACHLDGDSVEAEAWAYMAVRSLKGLPITFPSTTGAPEPLTGGTLHKP